MELRESIIEIISKFEGIDIASLINKITLKKFGFSEESNLKDLENYIKANSKEEEFKDFVKSISLEIENLTNEGLITVVNNSCKLTSKGLEFLKNKEYKVNALELLTNPRLLEIIKNELDITVVGEMQNKLSLFLLCLTKDFDPQAIYLAGQSSSGKSYLINQVLDFFPEEMIEKITRTSAHGLEYYFKDNDMNRKILVIQEALGGGEAESSLRPMISKDQRGLRILTVDFNRQAKEINIKGCPVYITSTATVDIEHQMTTRIWFLSPDESKEQTDKILDFQAEEASSIVPIGSKLKPIIREAIKLLQPMKIVIPYAKQLKQRFPIDKIKYRRDFQKLLTLIKTSAYLHQYQRPIIKYNEEKIIVATILDLYNAVSISKDIIKQTLMGLPELSIKILNTIKEISENLNEKQITHKTLAEEMKMSETTIRRFIMPLREEGFVTTEEGRPIIYHLSEIENPTLIALQNVINEINNFFSQKEFENWLFDKCYSVTKDSVSYENIIDTKHLVTLA